MDNTCSSHCWLFDTHILFQSNAVAFLCFPKESTLWAQGSTNLIPEILDLRNKISMLCLNFFVIICGSQVTEDLLFKSNYIRTFLICKHVVKC